MKIKALALAAATCTFGIVLAPIDNDSHAATPVQAQPRPKVGTAPVLKAKQVTKLEAKSAAAVPGETRNVKATLKGHDEVPVAGKRIDFKVEGRQPSGQSVVFALGTGVTNAQGEATVAWKVPELGQGAYALKASFAGDDGATAAHDQANFGVVKGITKIELSDVSYSALDSHGGPKYHTVMIKLIRQADNEVLKKAIKLTVNGVESTANLGPHGFVQKLLQPTDARSWTVKVAFAGDDANQATQAQRTYDRKGP